MPLKFYFTWFEYSDKAFWFIKRARERRAGGGRGGIEGESEREERELEDILLGESDRKR